MFVRERLQAALGGGHICATDLADFLVSQGVPFRDAHHLVGSLVRQAEEHGCQLRELPLEVLAKAHPTLITPGALSALDPQMSVENRKIFGGPARSRVLEAIADAEKRWLAGDGNR
jgi:argininosuccinate lyase